MQRSVLPRNRYLDMFSRYISIDIYTPWWDNAISERCVLGIGPCAVSSDRCECECWGGTTEAACAAPVSGVSAELGLQVRCCSCLITRVIQCWHWCTHSHRRIYYNNRYLYMVSYRYSFPVSFMYICTCQWRFGGQEYWFYVVRPLSLTIFFSK